MNKVDISIIASEVTDCIREAIQLCNTKGISCEVISSEVKCKGEFIAYMDPNTYYIPHFLYFPYICLKFGNTCCTTFTYHHIVNYNSFTDSFSVIKKNNKIIRNTKTNNNNKILDYPEYSILPGCIANDHGEPEEKLVLPEKYILDTFRDFFKKQE